MKTIHRRLAGPSRHVLARPLLCSILAGAAAIAPAGASPAGTPATGAAAAEKPVVTLRDIFAMQAMGAMVAGSDGSFAYARQRPADAGGDFGGGRLLSYEAGGDLVLFERSAKGHAIRVVASASAEASFLPIAFSPGGRRLLLLRVTKAGTQVGVHDRDSGTLRFFDAAPSLTFDPVRRLTGTGQNNLVWIDEDRFAYAALPRGEQPSYSNLRWDNQARLTAGREASWAGREPSFRLMVSGGDPAPRDGVLILADARDGASRELGRGLFSDLERSPDGRFLAANRLYDFAPPPADQQLNSLYDASRSSRLSLFDLHAGSQLALPLHRAVRGTISWSPSGRLAFLEPDPDSRDRAVTLNVIDPATLRVAPRSLKGLAVASARQWGGFQLPLRPLWLGTTIVVIARAADRETAGYFKPVEVGGRGAGEKAPGKPPSPFLIAESGDPVPLAADLGDPATTLRIMDDRLLAISGGALRSYDAQGRAAVIATLPGASGFVETGADRTAMAEQALVSLTRPDGTPQFARIDLASGRLGQRIAVPRGEQALAAGADAIVTRKDSAAGSSITIRGFDGRENRIETFNTFLAGRTIPRWRPLSYRSSQDGRALTGCMVLPADYRPGRRYPLIVEVYPAVRNSGCTDPARDPHPFSASAVAAMKGELLAARGYIVLQASMPADLHRSDAGPIDLIDIAAKDAADAAIAQGFADPGRIGLNGMSQGAICALWVATKQPMFRAVLATYGWADNWTHYFENGLTRMFNADFPPTGSAERFEIPFGDFGLGTTPFDDPLRYIRTSPLVNAPKITAPVLLMNGEMDAFDKAQFDAMFMALFRLNKRADYITYWGEGHSPSSPANLRHMWAATLAFYDRALAVARDDQGLIVWDGDVAKTAATGETKDTDWFMRHDGVGDAGGR
ncbi:S9 family peptidase [Sphingomonas colocasiae]|uniref:Prolyl oligopeptidase family serine peptidase n=1 Tax=Sphingomonas colocasiae TaxID=1848973 RepID=A0ABS7PUL3_9SPHN|nr:prolyl oligopeptidase family serine peptidase [Sphingomonas colocasiae]MBY8824968.1 prolyl oligopeptidase family serine peptidase [Sphingomonas colocasiae]